MKIMMNESAVAEVLCSNISHAMSCEAAGEFPNISIGLSR